MVPKGTLRNACADISPLKCLTIKENSLFSITKKNKTEVYKRLPDIPFCDNLRRRPLCHVLSKALEMSKKTLLTSNPTSNEL